MNKMMFTCFGHKNLLGTHKNTLEFTHDKELTLKGDCIIGVKANFKSTDIKMFSNKKIVIQISVGNIHDQVIAEFNNSFNHNHEMVIRKSSYVDRRTFAIQANKAAIDINRDLIDAMKNPEAKMEITISALP